THVVQCWCTVFLTLHIDHVDLVTSLPGLTESPNFKHYSGYLQAGPGKYFHYWFVESQHSPSTDPLVLWLNGGPGCSSMEGLLAENGPFHLKDDGKVYINPYSWNKQANVLYLDSPAGVGFSYSTSGNYQIGDPQVAEDNYQALQQFFVRFPSFVRNDFYVFAESYGGVYGPSLSKLIASGTAKINFKGFAVGNGMSSYALNDQSLIYFAYYHGLLSEELWTALNQYCCNSVSCNFYNNSDTSCQNSALLNCLNCSPYQQTMASIPGVPMCINATAIYYWLNTPSVRTALHIPSSVQSWELCSSTVGDLYQRVYMDMTPFYEYLLQKDLKILVYNGDVDMACNFLGSKWFVEGLNQKVRSVPYRPWFYNNQIAGYVAQYEKITFLTVKGSGHMVPQYKPGPALQMFMNYLSDSY
uniref:Carboxypeptidase n=1 Tax=Paramormyrops kingsleyae TaxID=1676925 RepID=A0A3B3RDK6_9TELE